MVLTPRLKIPIPEGLTQVSRATMQSWLDAIEANAATVTENTRPFAVQTSAWDGPGTRIRVTVGPGRARVGDQLIDKTDPTIVDINAPAAATTYSIYLADDGTFQVATGAVDVDGQARIHQVVTGTPASVFTVTDVRSELPGAPASGVVLSNDRYVKARAAGGTKYNAIGRNASDELVLGDSALAAATRFVKATGGYYAFEVNGSTKVRIDATGLGIGMTPANPLDVSGAARISGATTLQSTLAVAGNATFTSSFGVGTSPSFKGHVADTQTTNPLLVVEAAEASTGATLLQLRKQRGTLGTIDATSAVVSGDGIGEVAFYGANSSAYRKVASVRAEADGSPGPAVVPGRLLFYTSSSLAVNEVARFDSSGNFGIGMTPANKLDVTGNVRFSGTLTTGANIIVSTGSGTQPRVEVRSASGARNGIASYLTAGQAGVQLYANLSYDGSTWNLDSTAVHGSAISWAQASGAWTWSYATAGTNPRTPTTLMALEATGNLGIGGSSNISGYTGRVTTIRSTTTENGVEIYAQSDAIGSGAVYGFIDFVLGATTPVRAARIVALANGTSENAADLIFQTASAGATSTRMTIDSSGNVGVGASPATGTGVGRYLWVNGSTPGVLLKHTTGGGEHGMLTDGQGLYIYSAGSTLTTNNNIIFMTGGTAANFTGTERVRVDASGNVGVNMAPTHRLDVTAASSQAAARFTGASANWTMRVQSSTSASNGFGLLVFAGSNAADEAFAVYNAAATGNPYFHVRGDGQVWASVRYSLGTSATNTSALDYSATTILHGIGSSWSAQRFYTSGVQRVEIDNSGNITQSSSVVGRLALVLNNTAPGSGTSYNEIQLLPGNSSLNATLTGEGSSTGATFGTGAPALILRTVSNHAIQLWTNNTARIVFDVNGGMTQTGNSSSGVGFTYGSLGFGWQMDQGGFGIASIGSIKNGMVLGTATGGDKGIGTINVSSNLYKNNTAYTHPDFVFELWATGKVERFDNEAWGHYQRIVGDRLWSLPEIERHVRKHWRFPIVAGETHGVFTDHDNLGRDDIALALTEQAYTHLFDHEHQIEDLKAEVAELKSRLEAAGIAA